MSTRANYFKIGLFTLAALALLVGAIIAWGAGAFAADRAIVETYMDESVQGLDMGSPVKFRGVNVGSTPYEEVTVFFLDRPDDVPQPAED